MLASARGRYSNCVRSEGVLAAASDRLRCYVFHRSWADCLLIPKVVPMAAQETPADRAACTPLSMRPSASLKERRAAFSSEIAAAGCAWVNHSWCMAASTSTDGTATPRKGTNARCLVCISSEAFRARFQNGPVQPHPQNERQPITLSSGIISRPAWTGCLENLPETPSTETLPVRTSFDMRPSGATAAGHPSWTPSCMSQFMLLSPCEVVSGQVGRCDLILSGNPDGEEARRLWEGAAGEVEKVRAHLDHNLV